MYTQSARCQPDSGEPKSIGSGVASLDTLAIIKYTIESPAIGVAGEGGKRGQKECKP